MKKLITMVILGVSISSFAQSKLYQRAEKAYERLEYASAANLYQKIVKRNPADQVAKTRLAQCYKFLKTRSDWRSQPSKQNSSGANVPVK